ncbi:MAG: hypothetical protein C0484_27785 [Rhodospirillum sp.]|nr:hypothetical protein [Rhodospirillum sp.]
MMLLKTDRAATKRNSGYNFHKPTFIWVGRKFVPVLKKKSGFWNFHIDCDLIGMRALWLDGADHLAAEKSPAKIFL